jgi:hypothetical protein
MFSFDEVFSGHQQPEHKIPKTYEIGSREIKEEKLLSEGNGLAHVHKRIRLHLASN